MAREFEIRFEAHGPALAAPVGTVISVLARYMDADLAREAARRDLPVAPRVTITRGRSGSFEAYFDFAQAVIREGAARTYEFLRGDAATAVANMLAMIGALGAGHSLLKALRPTTEGGSTRRQELTVLFANPIHRRDLIELGRGLHATGPVTITILGEDYPLRAEDVGVVIRSLPFDGDPIRTMVEIEVAQVLYADEGGLLALVAFVGKDLQTVDFSAESAEALTDQITVGTSVLCDIEAGRDHSTILRVHAVRQYGEDWQTDHEDGRRRA